MAGFGVLDSTSYIQQQGQQGRAQGKENRLAQLSQQAYGATGQDRQSALAQMEGTAPGAGLAMGGKLQANDDDKAQRYGGAARYLLNAIETKNPAAAQGAYTATRGAWEELAQGRPIPEQFDETMLPMLHQIIAASEGAGGGSGAMPSGFREFEMTTRAAGLRPGTPEYQKAAQVALGTVGRAATGGMGFQIVKNADGTESMGRTNPRTGSFEVYSDQTGQFEQLGGAPASQPQGQPGMTQVQYATDDGSAIPPNEQAMARAAFAASGRGEDFDFNVNQPVQTQRQGTPGLGVSRRPEEQAALTTRAQEQAKIDAEIGSYGRMTGLEVDRATQKTRAEAEAKAGVERAGLEPKRQERVRLATTGIENVIATIDDAVGQVDWTSAGVVGALSKGVPGTPAFNLAKTAVTIKANIGFDRLQQMRDASPTGGALGQVAVQELDALQSTIASLDQGLAPDRLAANLRKVQQHYRGWLRAVTQADQAAQGSGRIKYDAQGNRIQ